MLLKEKIKADSVAALKEHNGRKVEVLRYLVSLIDKRELQLPPGKMSDEEAISVLRKELKNKEESRAMFEKASRADLVEELDYEIAIVKEYLPEEMSEEEVGKIVGEIVDKVGGNFGMVMREVMPRIGGRASGEVVSRIVREKLGEK
ncbi:MAG: GatB/YqeY domain-containing protein [Patescibacteria group bacterium]|jgi:uncharacterized protein YqeY